MCSVIGNSRNPDIYFRHDGRIDITANVAIMLGLDEGDVIDIWQENDEQYLYVLHKAEAITGRHAAVCKSTKKRNRFMRAWCVKLCKHILSLCGNSMEAHLYVGSPIVHRHIGKALPLITRNNLYSTIKTDKYD